MNNKLKGTWNPGDIIYTIGDPPDYAYLIVTLYLNVLKHIYIQLYLYKYVENIHKNQILEKSKIPADIGEDIYKQSQNFAEEIAKKLNFVGTMCVEYFIDTKNNLMVNEIAPRVHNSGHLTLNAFELSQFDCHIRAVCGLKNLPNKKISNAEMINILGSDINNYKNRKYNNNQFFFDYFKKNIKDKRKMGHLTILK